MNNTTTLCIRNKATLTSHGTRHNGCCKPVIAVDLDMTFNSESDLAEYCGVTIHAVSGALNKKQKTIGVYELDENGKRIRRIGKTRVKFANEGEEILDTIMQNSRNAKAELSKANKRIEELERKAALWDEYEAKQEAKRKAIEKVERRKQIEQRKQEEYQLSIARRQEAEKELAELMKGDEYVA